MTQAEKALLDPYRAKAKSDKAYLLQLTTLINDSSAKMRVAALKAFKILLQKSPNLATSSTVSRLKTSLRRKRKEKGHTADQAIGALYILSQTHPKIASRVHSVALNILKGKLGKVDKGAATLTTLLKQFIAAHPRNTLYVLDAAYTFMRCDHTNISQLQVLAILDQVVSIDALANNREWFTYLFEIAEHYATYSLLDTEADISKDAYFTHYRYNYIFQGAERTLEAYKVHMLKQQAALRLYQKLLQVNKTRINEFFAKDLRYTRSILSTHIKDATSSWHCFWRLYILRCYAAIDSQYIEPVLKVVRQAAQDNEWVVRAAAMDVMLSIAQNDFPKYGQEATTMAEKTYESKKEPSVIKSLGAYAYAYLHSMRPKNTNKTQAKS